MAETNARFSFMPGEDEAIEQAPPYSPTSSGDYSDDVAKREADAKRLSSVSGSNLPEVVPADMFQGKEVVYPGPQPGISNPEKVYLPPEDYPEPFDEEGGKEAVSPAIDPAIHQKPRPMAVRLNRRICGQRLKWVLLEALMFVVLVIALGAGLGAGLSSGSKHHGTLQTDPGALNGTSLALVIQSFPTASGGSEENLVMYFQHRDGHIRYMWLASNGTWVGGDASTDVANNAKNNTPITAVSYTWTGNNFWRVFYIDTTNTIRETWRSNATQGWALGLLSDSNVQPWNSDQVGMEVCWYGPTTSGASIQAAADTNNASDLAYRLVYPSDATTFQTMTFHGDTQLWEPEQTLVDIDGRSSPACSNSGAGSVDYLMLTDRQNAINVYWRDNNTTLANTTAHPTNTWTKSSVAVHDVQSAGSLSYTDGLYAQDRSNRMIKSFDINFAAENTTAEQRYEVVVQGVPGILGAGLATTMQVNANDTMIFYQDSDGNIMEYSRNSATGAQSNGTRIAVPYR